MEKKILYTDLDGTLIDTISGKTFPIGVWDMKLKFEVLDKIKELRFNHILIVSNQGGIESGFVNADAFAAKSAYIAHSVQEYCGIPCHAMYCTTNDEQDPYRKPNIKMLDDLTEAYVGDDISYIKSVALMIGDASGKEGQFSDSDKKTAENFGIDYMDVSEFLLMTQ
jgi:DNA 3'-phosphatase